VSDRGQIGLPGHEVVNPVGKQMYGISSILLPDREMVRGDST
jgi:hypothetical protein